MKAFGRVASLAAVIALATAAPAAADSIVFIKASNVWLASPDGSGQYQVTADGTSASPFETPSQADDGTIVAIRDFRLYRMRQNGAQLNPSASLPGFGGITEVAISPNGQVVAYSRTCGSGTSVTQCVSYTGPDGTGTPSSSPGGFSHPSWIDNTRTLVSTGNTVWTHVLGTDATNWFSELQPAQAEDGELVGTKLAMVDGGGPRLVFYRRLDNGFDTDPQPVCEATGPVDGPNGAAFADPTWAPDGGLVAWQEGDGIWTATSGADTDCPTVNGTSATIPGGSEPDFGPAAVNPGPRPTTAPAGSSNGTPTQPQPQPQTQPQTQPQPQTEPRTQTAPRPLVLSAPRLLARAFPARRGFRFRLSLSSAARVTVRVERLGGARPSRVLGTVAFRGRAGANTFAVRKVNGTRLRPGRYRARVVASAAGAASRPAILRFRLR